MQEFVLKRDDGKYFMLSLVENRQYEIGDATPHIGEARRCADKSGANNLIGMLPDKHRWEPIPVRVIVEEIK